MLISKEVVKESAFEDWLSFVDFDTIRGLLSERAMEEALSNNLTLSSSDVMNWVRDNVSTDDLDEYVDKVEEAIRKTYSDPEDKEDLDKALKDLKDVTKTTPGFFNDADLLLDLMRDYDIILDTDDFYDDALSDIIGSMGFDEKAGILGLDHLSGKDLVDRCVELDLLDYDDLETAFRDIYDEEEMDEEEMDEEEMDEANRRISRGLKESKVVKEDEKNWDDPNSWHYISKYPMLVEFGKNLGEKKLELLNNAILSITQAMENLESADSVYKLRDFKYLLSHADMLTKCWNALKRNGNW